MRDQRDELDDALDDALASYCVAPETEGLERRILVRVTERTRRTHPTRPLGDGNWRNGGGSHSVPVLVGGAQNGGTNSANK
jgi:hypothetical protein